MKESQLGVSLVELMVTLAVLVILLSIAAPSFTSIRDVKRLRSAAEATYAYLQFARSESIKQGRNLIVRVSPGDGSVSTNWCLGIYNNGDCDCHTQGSCQFGSVGALDEKLIRSSSFEGISLSSNNGSVKVNSRRGTTNAGTITLIGANSAVLEVKHSLRGRIRICSDSVRGYPSCS